MATRFKKGESRPNLNPFKRSAELAKVKRLTQEEIQVALTMILDGSILEVDTRRRSGEESALIVWIASIVKKAIKTGNYQAFEVLMNRAVGKVTQHHDVSLGLGAILSSHYGVPSPEAQAFLEKTQAPAIEVESSPIIDDVASTAINDSLNERDLLNGES